MSRPLSYLTIAAWTFQMGWVAKSAYLSAEPLALSTDLARYGASAQWKGVYYKGEKIGFVVTQTTPEDDGYLIQEDGRLQMLLLGAQSATLLRTRVRVDRSFALRDFEFALDPGTGPVRIAGTVEGRRLTLAIHSSAGSRTETRELDEPPALSLNLSRWLAAEGLSAGMRKQVLVFDPATLRNAPMEVVVAKREVVNAAGRPTPAFRVETRFSGVASTSWITDLGEIVREESPTGLLVVREGRDRATALATPGQLQTDMLRAAAVVPRSKQRIDNPSMVERLKLHVTLAGFDSADLEGAGQTHRNGIVEIRDLAKAAPGPADPLAAEYSRPEPFIESDAPEIVAEAERATAGLSTPRARAERLVRHVHTLVDKRPTVSLPSALEVLRTRVGDCNEHTALYVALARAAGLPARVAVGLVALGGAFYYHAWAEVYLAEDAGRGQWLPVDPTLNQFPADPTHLRLARGGLDQQARILSALGKLEIEVLEVQAKPDTVPVLVGRPRYDTRPLEIPLPQRSGARCWSRAT